MSRRIEQKKTYEVIVPDFSDQSHFPKKRYKRIVIEYGILQLGISRDSYQHPYFFANAEEYISKNYIGPDEPLSKLRFPVDFNRGGQCTDLIGEYAPHLGAFLMLHLHSYALSPVGEDKNTPPTCEPMHASSNPWYLHTHSKDHTKLPKGEFNPKESAAYLKTNTNRTEGITTREQMSELVCQLNPHYRAIADALIAIHDFDMSVFVRPGQN